MTTIIAHRGARNIWPENTMTGFRNAIGLGITATEFDIHLTKAGELVVIHDPTIDRTAETTGVVADLTPEQRKAVKLKGSDDGIPSLDEVLALLAQHPQIEFHAEIKAGVGGVPYEGLEKLVAEALHKHGVADRAYMTSFNPSVLEKIREADPTIRRLISMNRESAEKFGGYEALLARGMELAEVIAVNYELFEEKFDDLVTKVGLDKLCVWTPNEPELIRKWLERKPGFLCTDRPDIGLEIAKELGV